MFAANARHVRARKKREENAMDYNECCPKFAPEPWDGKSFEWKGKPFVKARVATLFYAPMNFGGTMRKLDAKIRAAGAQTPDSMCLCDHTSKWHMDLYVAVDKKVPGVENVGLSGAFLSKAYEGLYKDTARWCDDFKKFAASKNLEVAQWFMWYTACPKCAKRRGQNNVVIIGRVEPRKSTPNCG